MTLLAVKDANGATQNINTTPALGQAVSAASLPVVLATDQSAVPVVDANAAAALATLHADLTTIAGDDSALGSQADAAWSGTGNGSLVAIAKASWAKLSAIASALASTLSVNVANAVALGASSANIGNVGINAGANVIGAVTQSGTWTFGATVSCVYNNVLPIFTSGQTTQLQTDANGRLLISGSLSSSTVVTYSTTPPVLTNGTTAPLQSDASGNLKVNIAAASAVPVTGTFWQATQPVSFSGQTVGLSGSLPAFAATPTVNLGTLNGAATSALQSSIVTALGSPLQAGGNVAVTSLPAVTGAVTANAGTNLNTSALALESGGNLAAILAKIIAAPATAANQNSTAAGTSASNAQAVQGVTGGVAVPTTETYANLAASASPVSIAQAATLIVAARTTGRKEVTLILEAAVAVRIGGSGVTGTTNGVLLQGIAGEAITISGGAAVYGYAPSGTAIVSALEVY